MVKLFIKLQLIGVSAFFIPLSILLLFFRETFFDFLQITIGESYVLNQLKADLGGFWLLAGSIPILWFRTKDNFWIRVLYVSVGFVMIARITSFIFDGFHPVTLFFFAVEIVLVYISRFILKNYPEGSFFT
jgi:hypothetical protein|tara:strand:- start:247 stop:639 length:393 start_codon:yes stop_codon:yes gene_type:complete